MSLSHGIERDRAQAAFGSLSAIGAAVTGFGVGVLFADPLAALAWPAVVAGVAVHLFGMVGTMRLRSAEDYRPSLAETVSYWLCWVIILALLVYAALELVR